MTCVLTVRISPELLAKTEARAAQLELDRGKYVRELITQDVTQNKGAPRTFASKDFLGSVSLGSGPYSSRRVRDTVRRQLAAP